MTNKNNPYITALQDICDTLGVDIEITTGSKEEALSDVNQEIRDMYQSDIQTLRNALNGKQVMMR